jgi:biopolymer transport protein ExbD
LIVQVTTDKKVTLNNEAEGTLDDLSSLKKRLAKIFRERMTMGVFREGTNEVEQTVFIKASSLLQLSDVVKVVDALKEAGTSPVNLQIDDLQ